MNYRHDYHAGNFADVLKHVVLARVLTYLKRKDSPFRVVDTHAGGGIYDLSGEEAVKTEEWRDGIGRVLDYKFSAGAAELLQPYLDAVRSVNVGTELRSYPGSPLIARYLMRDADVLIANELRADDFTKLKGQLHRTKSTTVLNIDGYTAIKSLLPLKERRGVVLIDPPFENRDEFQKLEVAIAEGLRRFATGVFLVWYPIKEPAICERFLANLKPGLKFLDVRLATQASFPGLGLTDTGVLIANPPHALEAELSALLPELTECLREGAGAAFSLRTIAQPGDVGVF